MKLITLIFIGCTTLLNFSFAQETSLTQQDVYEATTITCYGFDFSQTKITDSKRYGQKLKTYFFELSDDLQSHLNEGKFSTWMKKDKVTYSMNPVNEVNTTIVNERIVSAVPHSINKDSLQSLVNRYQIAEKSGIGYVFIFENFNSPSKYVSAYGVFFDISTKQILRSDYVVKRDGNSYNRMTDWNAAAFMAVKELTNSFLQAGNNGH